MQSNLLDKERAILDTLDNITVELSSLVIPEEDLSELCSLVSNFINNNVNHNKIMIKLDMVMRLICVNRSIGMDSAVYAVLLGYSDILLENNPSFTHRYFPRIDSCAKCNKLTLSGVSDLNSALTSSKRYLSLSDGEKRDVKESFTSRLFKISQMEKDKYHESRTTRGTEVS